MIPIQEDLRVNTSNLFKRVKDVINDYIADIGAKKECIYYEKLISTFRSKLFWDTYILSHNVCMHIYKNGSKAGTICGAKVFVKTDNKLQKYKCSRHCRDYGTKGRTYDETYIRCSYIRANEKQCKHRCNSNAKYCYIHAASEVINGSIIDIEKLNKSAYNEAINKLKKKRNLYFKLKKLKKNKKQNLSTQIFQREGQNNFIKIKKKKYNIGVCTLCGCAEYGHRYQHAEVT